MHTSPRLMSSARPTGAPAAMAGGTGCRCGSCPAPATAATQPPSIQTGDTFTTPDRTCAKLTLIMVCSMAEAPRRRSQSAGTW